MPQWSYFQQTRVQKTLQVPNHTCSPSDWDNCRHGFTPACGSGWHVIRDQTEVRTLSDYCRFVPHWLIFHLRPECTHFRLAPQLASLPEEDTSLTEWGAAGLPLLLSTVRRCHSKGELARYKEALEPDLQGLPQTSGSKGWHEKAREEDIVSFNMCFSLRLRSTALGLW